MTNENANSVGLRDSLSNISQGAVLFFGSRLFRNAASFAFYVLLTRTLGAGLFGIYSYGYTLLTMIMIVTNFGSDKVLLKFLPQYEADDDRQNRVLGLAYLTSIALAVGVGTVIFLLAPQISAVTLSDPLFVSVLKVFAIVAVFETLVRLISNTFRGFESPRPQVLVQNVLPPTLRLVFAGIATAIGYSLMGVMGAVLLATIAAVVAGGILYVRRIGRVPSITRSYDETIEQYRFALPAFAKDAGGILFNSMDVVMVGFFLAQTAVGIYNAALVVAALLALPLTAFNQLFPPVASRLYAEDRFDDLEELFSTVTRWTFTVTVLPFLGTALYSSELLTVFGEEFAAGAGVLSLFAIGQLLNSAVGPSGNFLLMTGRQRVVMINQWVFGLANVALNYVFIQAFGLIGAGAATSLILGVLNLIRLAEVWYFHSLHPYSSRYLVVVLAGALAAAVMWFVGTVADSSVVLFVGGASGAAVFVPLVYLFGLTESDREVYLMLVDR